MIDDRPRLPYRCGTMFLSATPEQKRAMADAWEEDERVWLSWYERQPADQLQEADHIEARNIRQTLARRTAPPPPKNESPRLSEAEAAKWRERLLKYTKRERK